MGTLIRNAKTPLILVTFLLGAYNTTIAGRIIYVDADAAGANNGSSWQNAYNYLQDTLADANSAAKPVEIRVAGGSYRPDEDTLHPSGTGDRQAMFQLLNGVNIKGGYAGLDQPDLPNDRNVDKYRSILSGDLNGNDVEPGDFEWQNVFDFTCDPNRADNSYHVVIGNATDSTAVLNGFTITAGHSNNQDPCDTHIDGGGMVNFCGSPTVIDCTFYRNSARSDEGNYNPDGGGMFNSSSNPVLRNCKFIENFVFGGNTSSHGGGMCNINSNPTLTNCLFKNNIAEGYDSEYYGGGMCNFNSNPILTNCSFTENHADWGGAICNSNGSPIISGCIFTGNSVSDCGGAIITGGGQPALTKSTFKNNYAYSFGGAICSSASLGLTISDCSFTSNQAADGGAIYSNFFDIIEILNCSFNGNSASRGGAVDSDGAWYNDPNSSTAIIKCTFSGNSAYQGGGLYSGWNKKLLVTNCAFTGNRSIQYGGAIYTYGSLPYLTNCTFAANLAQKGNALGCDWEPSTVQLTNSILWDGGSEIFDTSGSTLDVTYCDIKGGWPTGNNIDLDPCFASPGYWDPSGTPQDANDDFWVDGDYHLKSQAGRWDTDEGRWTKDEVTSLCIDAGDPASPIGLEPFPNGGIINMGAYGGTPEASKSYFGEPVCETIVAGDINGDCIVNLKDFALMALHWLEDHNP